VRASETNARVTSLIDAAIRVFACGKHDMDGRHKAGRDESVFLQAGITQRL
jgi:hypothetical protein